MYIQNPCDFVYPAGARKGDISPLTPFVKSCLGVVKMSRFQYLNLAVFFGLGFFLYGFIFAKYHYKFTIFFGFLGLFWGGLVAFLILMAWNDDERE